MKAELCYQTPTCQHLPIIYFSFVLRKQLILVQIFFFFCLLDVLFYIDKITVFQTIFPASRGETSGVMPVFIVLEIIDMKRTSSWIINYIPYEDKSYVSSTCSYFLLKNFWMVKKACLEKKFLRNTSHDKLILIIGPVRHWNAGQANLCSGTCPDIF